MPVPSITSVVPEAGRSAARTIHSMRVRCNGEIEGAPTMTGTVGAAFGRGSFPGTFFAGAFFAGTFFTNARFGASAFFAGTFFFAATFAAGFALPFATAGLRFATGFFFAGFFFIPLA